MLLLALLLALAAPAHAGDPWRWPVRGAVITAFHTTPNPFAPGQHRGIDIAAPRGARVRSACPGRVTFAGRVPGRGRVVAVECGALVATYLELGSVAVRRGGAVGPGSLIGTVAASHLQLGARRAGRRNGYLDPLTLLAARRPPPLGASPARRRPWRSGPRGRAPAPNPRPAPAREPSATPEAQVPLAAWLGLALFASGMPLGAVVRRRRRRNDERRNLDLRTAGEGA